jgi:hypothetical protein
LRIAALIFGLLAGVAAGLILALGDIETYLAALPVFAPRGQLVARLLVYLVPAIGWVGAGMVLARPRFGGVLLLASAIGWAVLALAAGHGAVLFAAPPFTFALAAGIVAMFGRRRAEPRARAESSPAREPEPSRAVVAPQPAQSRRTDKPLLERPARSELATTRTRIVDPTDRPAASTVVRPIPPPFRDEVALDDAAADVAAMDDAPPAGVPEEDPAAPIVAAMASATTPPVEPPADAPALDSPAVELVEAGADPNVDKEAATAGAEAANASATEAAGAAVAPADPDAAALRARRPGDWALPTPAAPARPRYAAEQQSVPLARTTSVSVSIEPGAADAPRRPLPVEPVAAAIAVPPPAAEAILEPAPPPPPSAADEPPETAEAAAMADASAATLDFAPVDDFGRGSVPPPERNRPAAAPLAIRERRRRSRRVADEADEPPAPRHGAIRAILRGAIAAAFVAVVLGGAGAVYLDYLRGPQSLLFGHRAAARHAAAPAASAAATAAKPAATPKAATPEPTPAPAKPTASDAPAPSAPAATPGPANADAPAPATQASPAAAPAPAPAPMAFTDPVRYCEAVRTIDAPDSHYTGPAVPPAVATALLIPESTPASQVHWRCANGIALACNANRTHACDPTPTVQQMLDYCAKHPGASAMPAPNGSWSCNGTRPVIPEDQSWPVDARGFYPDAWVRVSPIGAG